MQRLPPSELDGLVLALLAERPSHGAAVARELIASGGTVYRTLHRLEREGLLAGARSSDRGRRLYRVTRPGREALAARKLEWRTAGARAG